jgi:hypothetical protein
MNSRAPTSKEEEGDRELILPMFDCTSWEFRVEDLAKTGLVIVTLDEESESELLDFLLRSFRL